MSARWWGGILITFGLALLGVCVALNTKEHLAPAWLWYPVAFYAGMVIRHILE